MSRLSIKKTLSQSFSTYITYITTLAPLGAFIGLLTVCWHKAPLLINSYIFNIPLYAACSSCEKLSLIQTMINAFKISFQSQNTPIIAVIIILTVLFGFIYSLIYLSFLKELIHFKDKKQLQFSSLFKWNQTQLQILFGLFLLAVSLGIITGLLGIITNFCALPFNLNKYLFVPGLLILVGIVLYLALRLWFFYFFMLDKQLNIIESFKASWLATKNSVLKLSALLILTSMISTGILFGLTFTISFIFKNCAYECFITQPVSLIILSIVSVPFFGLIFVNCYKQLTH